MKRSEFEKIDDDICRPSARFVKDAFGGQSGHMKKANTHKWRETPHLCGFFMAIERSAKL